MRGVGGGGRGERDGVRRNQGRTQRGEGAIVHIIKMRCDLL